MSDEFDDDDDDDEELKLMVMVMLCVDVVDLYFRPTLDGVQGPNS
jgi:hypothetical protein